MKKRTSDDVYYRTQKFEIFPKGSIFNLLVAVSDHLRVIWNDALRERQENFDKHFRALYQKFGQEGVDESAVRKEIKSLLEKHNISLYDQINLLTGKRRENESFSSIPRAFQEGTLVTLDGAYKSFFSLKKKGDPDARPPKFRLEGFFIEIHGRAGFKLVEEEEGKTTFVLSTKESKVVFPVPKYQADEIKTAQKVKSFTLYRDEPDLQKPGRFWVSVVCEYLKPQVVPKKPENTVYLALGASGLGIKTQAREEVVRFWRPDKHWATKIQAVQARMKKRKKWSRGWKKLAMARQEMFKKMSRQQKINHREVVARLIDEGGRHFIVTELVVRSKLGKLADSEKPDRGGATGLNWSAQNTGSIGEFVAWLEKKVVEVGGSVEKVKVDPKWVTKVDSPEERKLGIVRSMAN